MIQRVGEKERQYVEEVLSNNFRSSAGYKMTKRLEDAFAEKFGVNYAVAFCNGTATLHAALEVLGVREGDEVIVPPLTMSSTTFCVLQANATPVFADVDPDTFQIDAKSIESKITSKTKAIIPVSLYGLAPDFDAIKAVAKKHNLAILEDDHMVCVANRCQRVRNNNSRTTLHQFIQCFQNHALTMRIQVTGCFIQQQIVRIVHDRTGDGNALALTTGEIDATGSYPSIKPIG